MKKAEDRRVTVEIAEELPEEARTSGKKAGQGGRKRSHVVAFLDEDPTDGGGTRTNGAGVKEKKAPKAGNTGRVKARKPNEKITPASIFRKMITFGKVYQIESEQDFQEAARIYAEEAYLIDQMRDQIAEEGLTVMKTYKTGDVPVAHPLLSELPRHVESANKCLTTISNMISDRGAKKEKAARDLDAFRLH